MKKLIIIIFSVCILLTGCAKEQKVKQIFDDDSEGQSEEAQNSSDIEDYQEIYDLNNHDIWEKYASGQMKDSKVSFIGEVYEDPVRDEYNFEYMVVLGENTRYVVKNLISLEPFIFKKGDRIKIKEGIIGQGFLGIVEKDFEEKKLDINSTPRNILVIPSNIEVTR